MAKTQLWLIKAKYRVNRSTGKYTRWFMTIIKGDTETLAISNFLEHFWARNAKKRHEIETLKVISVEPY